MYPQWTPSSDVFGTAYDVNFVVLGYLHSSSCAGHCGGQAPGECWCDKSCTWFDDCCDDVCEACPDNNPCDHGIDPYSCSGICGEQTLSGCWCDDLCCSYGDCCEDQYDTCEMCNPSTDPHVCFGDLNNDGWVDGADLLILLGSWGPCEDCLGDINGDGVVDGADLLMMLGNWGVGCAPRVGRNHCYSGRDCVGFIGVSDCPGCLALGYKNWRDGKGKCLRIPSCPQ